MKRFLNLQQSTNSICFSDNFHRSGSFSASFRTTLNRIGLLCIVVLFVGTCLYTNILFSEEIRFVQSPDTSSNRACYPGNRAPLAPSPFIKLPVGTVHGAGWAGRWLELQRDGLTGKLGGLSKWLDKKDNAWLMKGGKYGWEELPYWLRGYCDLAWLLNDKEMKAEAQIWIEAIFKSQRPDGYFGPANPDGPKGCDLWPNMLVLFLVQNYYEFTGDARAIDFMTKYFHWILKYPENKFLKTYWENSRAGDLLWSCFQLYNITGDKELLKAAEKINRNTANWKQGSTLPNWHNVNIAQCFRQPAIWWMLSKNESDKKAAYRNFRLIRNCYGQVPGGMFGADENARHGYIDPRQGIETCGIFEQMTSDMILLRITGDTFWADNAEDVAFNSAPASVMPDFKSLRYLTCPNQVVSDSKNHHPGIDNKGPFMAMNPFSSRCCQHNHSHGWPYYIENMWQATPDGGLAATLYGASRVDAKVYGGKVTIEESSNYPFEESIRFVVRAEKDLTFPLYLRIPAWTAAPKLKVNDRLISSLQPAGKKEKWLKIDRNWKNGDRVELVLPMSFAYRFWQQNGNCVSLDYGPLTFSLKIKEVYKKFDGKAAAMGDSGWQKGADEKQWPSFEIYSGSDWNYGLVNPANVDLSKLQLIRKSWPKDNFPWTVDAVPFSVSFEGKKIPDWKIDEFGLCSPVPQSPVETDQPKEKLELIPMGAARLRISAFPVVE